MPNEIYIKIFQVFLLLLPAGLANMTPPLFKKINFLNYPIDFGIYFRGRRLLGDNKTFRGLFFGVAIAIIGTYLQKLFYPVILKHSIIDYSNINFFLLGFLLGLGALFGDLIGSFFKRQLRIAPGGSFIPFDQIDWIIGALFFLNFYVRTEMILNFLAILLFFILHIFVKLAGFYIGINENKF